MKELFQISSRSALSRCLTVKDNDCFEVNGPQNQEGKSTQVTTRVITNFNNEGTSTRVGTGTKCIARSAGKMLIAKQGSDGSCIVDKDYVARNYGNAGTNSHGRSFAARSDVIPAMSVHDEDYSSY